MGSKVLLLWLEGPMQSWGTSRTPLQRMTGQYPTKSGIWGMIFNALGWYGRQKEALRKIHDLPVRILGYQKSSVPILRDYQTMGGGFDENDPWQSVMTPRCENGKKPVNVGGTRIIVKHYLADARFAAFVRVPEEWADEIAEALVNPAGTLYLGRKACIPSAPLFAGLWESETEAEKRLEAYLKELDPETERRPVFEVREVGRYDPDGEVLLDNPTAFGGISECSPRYVAVRRLAA